MVWPEALERRHFRFSELHFRDLNILLKNEKEFPRPPAILWACRASRMVTFKHGHWHQFLQLIWENRHLWVYRDMQTLYVPRPDKLNVVWSPVGPQVRAIATDLYEWFNWSHQATSRANEFFFEMRPVRGDGRGAEFVLAPAEMPSEEQYSAGDESTT
ncbi:uncharacterized protein BCR38DRAFT_419072 [Pseudomassariella vexata]|uniref:Uncharacterized protein n=1 Tax=Pseudomassariella vexata TaxID=1141098 RepID=A0A1Y2EKV4_9PEZI|nr:uncharacterized protein BCR38DRAFT_419072 [Pseudomassariella vexata]ORY72151.1 hypothetical protein BCR38DRAFT_419072 [Pseudomassariella vexata]